MNFSCPRLLFPLLLAPFSPLIAGEPARAAKVIEMAKTPFVSGALSVTVMSNYIVRGVSYEDQGAIIQPALDLYFKLYEGTGFINMVRFDLEVLNSVHTWDEPFVVGGKGGSYFEHDYFFQLRTVFAKDFTLLAWYGLYFSPADRFEKTAALNFTLSYNDSRWWGGRFAWNPAITVLREAENKVSSGMNEGNYYEVALTPTFPVGSVTVTVPVKAGFGSSDFYGSFDSKTGTLQNETFGYASVGLYGSLPLSWVPKSYGSWSVNAGVNYYYLGPGCSDFFTPERGGNVRGFSNHEWAFKGGVVVAF